MKLGQLYCAKTPVDSPLVQISADTWRDLGEERVVISPMTGGSGPLSLITGHLGIPTVMTGGLASPDRASTRPTSLFG